MYILMLNPGRRMARNPAREKTDGTTHGHLPRKMRSERGSPSETTSDYLEKY